MGTCNRVKPMAVGQAIAPTGLFLVMALLVLLLSGAFPSAAYATTATKGASVVPLSQGITYTSYDITGDGKADAIKTVAADRQGSSYGRIKVYVNGKLALSRPCGNGSSVQSGGAVECPQIDYLRLKNGRSFLYIATWGDDIGADVCGVFQYKAGKLKQVINGNTFFGKKFCSHRNGTVKKVSGNTITMHYEAMSWMAGFLSADYTYKFKSGTLKQASKQGKLYAGQGKSCRALKSMKAYKSPTSNVGKFTIKKGKRVKFLKVYVKGNTVRFQVRAGGKTGWIKCATSSRSSLLVKDDYGYRRPPFEGIYWAG